MNKHIRRPEFPKRAVITGGMPYGNKDLHFGHIGGVFVHADTYARFLKDRIGKDNVIFVSGTDCYGSPIITSHKNHCEKENVDITVEDYVHNFHVRQKQTLENYDVNLSLYATSAFGDSGKKHNKVSEEVFNLLYDHGFLKELSCPQFYDPIHDIYLNGRQVLGKCPYEGCPSEKGYADECDLGHQYPPEDLIDPISVLSGEKPELRNTSNWYFDLERFAEPLKALVENLKNDRSVRPLVIRTLEEFLLPPAIHITRKEFEPLSEDFIASLGGTLEDIEKKPSVTFNFNSLDERDVAKKLLDGSNVRYRSGKTITPFRLTGNIEWGVPVPEKEDLKDLTFWVWPESLWAPISFTKTYLDSIGSKDSWTKWWTDPEAKVYQFIGEDNIHFYGLPEMAMLMGYYASENPSASKDMSALDISEMNFPTLVANHHILFMNEKASSSGAIKPPMAHELLDYYTSDQLRMHFLSLGLSKRSVSFNPMALDETFTNKAEDPVLKDGFLLTKVFNRMVRSCFYTSEKYNNWAIPTNAISDEITDMMEKAVYEYERNMAQHEFHRVIITLDNVIRKLSKYWSREMKIADAEDNNAMRLQVLADMFYGVKVCLTLLHPVVPTSSENVKDYLGLDDSLWSWDHILESIQAHYEDKDSHTVKEIPAKFDFFVNHESFFEA
ncbi:MAG: class I tRNA ligase family protein [Clostridia bacterium]|nr:class I tRNA ligase family protein [Clostridia bacterium]